MRNSGEPYVTHPLVSRRSCPMTGMDTETVAAAVLHDTVEDEDRVLILRAGEAERIAVVVNGPRSYATPP